jgi:AmiR/NasT family two-component response regulator
MNAVQSIAIADGLVSERESLRRRLVEAGHHVVCEESDLAGLAAKLKGSDSQTAPDLALVTFPPEQGEPVSTLRMLGLTNSPLVAIVDHSEQITAEMRDLPALMGILVRPVALNAIAASVEIALRQIQRVAEVQHRLDEAERLLAERKLIERAKGLLMLQAKLSEEEAFSRMRQVARSSRRSIAAVAQDILVTHQLITGAAG